ncbi:PIG-L deacetylase family protein [Marinovum sp.]|uniref:PIG-L deacetylase family protein n=1 Tax=Marinovum sp. TaxID=2024839 RepID=UPI002B26894C|nr:PIG-L deacetylase family protein [Marinovum sp.]
MDRRGGGASRDLCHFTGGRPVMVLAPHPDDESLGCGGLLAACFEADGAHVVCVTDGRMSHPGSRDWPAERLAVQREQELLAAVAALGGRTEDVSCLRHPDQAAPEGGPAVEAIAALCEERDIGTLFGPAPEDPHRDHLAVAKLARAVCARQPGLRLFDYSVWARWRGLWAEDAAQSFETSGWRARKTAAIAAHRSQLGQLVTDDPEGFAMPPGFASFFAEQPERFREVRR